MNKRLTAIVIVSIAVLAVAALLLSRSNLQKIASGEVLTNLMDNTPITGNEASAYVLCRLSEDERIGILPLPAEGESSFPIRQTRSDGTETENVLHLFPDGFFMESSTCKNQNCVRQGNVTLENREIRALQNCVVCLPNYVTAELYTAEEIQRMLKEADQPAEGE